MSVAFESSQKKAKEREKLREARELVLEKAKADYERKERVKELSKQKGEGTWILPSLNDRIEQDSEMIKKTKKRKKDKKKKKKKKKKVSDSSSESDSDAEPMWVEKSTSSNKTETGDDAVKGPKLERDSWMTEAPGFFPCVSRDELRERKQKKEKYETPSIDELGTHERELNPYWKDGGTGLPEQKADGKEAAGSVAGDGGLSWLRKAYQRLKERAKEEGSTLEDLAAAQYGSLEKLESMMAEAEQKARGGRRDRDDRERGWQRDRRERSLSRERRRSRSRERRERSRSGSRTRRRRSRSSDRRARRRNSRDRDSRSRSRERRSRSRERKRSRSPATASSKLKGSSSRFMKPGDMDTSDRSRRRSPERTSSWRKPGFMKAGESRNSPPKRRDSPPRRRRRRSSSSASSSSGASENERRPSKKFTKPEDSDDDSTTRATSSKAAAPPRWKKQSAVSQPPSNVKGEYSSSDSESESESDHSEAQEQKAEETVVILSEDEMNKLGAKIMKAELMGNQALADKLKAQLDAVRKAKEAAGVKKTAAAERAELKESKEENVVVLTRTDRAGNVRPVVDMDTGSSGGGGGKRRKKKNVPTHGKQGERERYFDDDDKHDIKSLVAQEKLSTAEDANAMFARLAGRGIERTDDDHQLDDVFISRAAKMQGEGKLHEKEKLASILESRKVQSAMEKCHFCFDNVPKHLIIAIGLKVYLCLPAHRSMVDGHCLIVPMQHVTSGTHVDEDVWAEIQIFRKGLTRMFGDRDEDVVFMETSVNLRRHPHMRVEVIPMPREVGDMAPIYFKKAIMDTGSEWAQNKKVVDLSKKDIRSAVPKGFPYFSVDFGLQGGFAHVVEEEKDFPSYFGREICGGMLELGPDLWRKPHRENFDAQREKVLKFAELWKPYDWTARLKASKTDDSD